MAYLKPLPDRRCDCGSKATRRLINRYNAECGDYCRRCGNAALAKLVQVELRRSRSTAPSA